jgi:adenylosuccinate lyase
MSAVWTDEARMAAWLEVELAVCEAWAQLGRIPEEALAEIKAKAAFDVDRVCEIEQAAVGRDDLAERRQRALQFPPHLPADAGEQDFQA